MITKKEEWFKRFEENDIFDDKCNELISKGKIEELVDKICQEYGEKKVDKDKFIEAKTNIKFQFNQKNNKFETMNGDTYYGKTYYVFLKNEYSGYCPDFIKEYYAEYKKQKLLKELGDDYEEDFEEDFISSKNNNFNEEENDGYDPDLWYKMKKEQEIEDSFKD